MPTLPKDTELVLTKLLRDACAFCRGEHQAWDVWATGWLEGKRPTAAVHRRALDYATGFGEGVRLSLWITDWHLADKAFDGGESPPHDARFLRARAREEVARAFARGIGARRIEVQEQLVEYARRIVLLAKKASKSSPVRKDLLNVPESGNAWQIFYGSR